MAINQPCVIVTLRNTLCRILEEFKISVYSNVRRNFMDHNLLCGRADLAPRNPNVISIKSSKIQELVQGIVDVYSSIQLRM